MIVYIVGIVVFGLIYYRVFISDELAVLEGKVSQLEMQLGQSQSTVSSLQAQLSGNQFTSQIDFAISEVQDAMRQLSSRRESLNSTLAGTFDQARMNYTQDIASTDLTTLNAQVQQAQLRYVQGVQNIETDLGTLKNRIGDEFGAQIDAYAAESMITLTNEHGRNFSNGIVSQLGGGTRSSFVRWGSDSCPDVAGTTLLYSGVVGGSAFFTRGGGHNPVCMPMDPEVDAVATEPGTQTHSRIWGAEYATPPWDQNVPCAVCSVTIGAEVMMVPARNSCPSGWTMEYDGYLMSEGPNNFRSSFVCVDRSTGIVPGTSQHADAMDFFLCRADCPSLQCPPFSDTSVIGCAVCSK